MRVALVTSSFLPHIGGKEIVVHNLMKQYQKNDNVKSVLLRFAGMRYRLRHSFPYRYHLYPSILPGQNTNISLSLFLEKILWGLDVVHLHGIYPLGLVLGQFKTKFNYKLVLTPHGDDVQKVPEIGFGLGVDATVEEKLQYILGSADAVTAVSPLIAQDIVKVGNVSSVLIPNGVNASRFNSPELKRQAEALKSRLGLGRNTKLVLAVGGNRAVKGFDVLIKAMIKVRENVSDARLVIVGRGCEKLMPLIRSLNMDPDVVLPGSVPDELTLDPMTFEAPDDELIRYYLAADVFVMSSYSEAFGLVTIEAMAAGKPVVATRLAGDRDASGGVIDGYNGFLVEPGNVDQMAEKIIVLLKNDAMREKMGRKSREIVQTFDWSEVGKKYVQLYGDVCNK